MEKKAVIDKLLEVMISQKSSDLHIKVGSPPMYRINGVLHPADYPSLTQQDTEDFVAAVMPVEKRNELKEMGTSDFSYSILQKARYRVNAFHQRGSLSLVFRLVNFTPPDFSQLKLPPVIEAISRYQRGLVLLTGVTGSGKSTTLSAVIEFINRTRRVHVITIEDPIEYLYKDKLSIINQIELGNDTPSFECALKHVLRQNPDVVLVGEIRDRITMKTILTATETGLLVLSTLHTPDSKQSINRILHFFSSEDERLILEQLAMNLRAVVSQRLIKSIDGKGMVPACEIMINTPIVTKLMREGRVADIKQAIQNREEGMQTFDQALVELTQNKLISDEEAVKYVEDISAFRRMIKGSTSTSDHSGLIGF